MMIEWIMYADIQRLKRKGFSKKSVAKKVGKNRETVSKYWDMTPAEYEVQLTKHRARKPDVYKELIIEWLSEFSDVTAAQLYDWCKERSPLETLDFQKRSFQDYVNSIREEYDIKKPDDQLMKIV